MSETGPPARASDLRKRLVSAVVMASLALTAVVLGGWPFVMFWTAAAVGVFWEWNAMVAGGATARAAGIAALLAAAAAAGIGQVHMALAALAAGSAGVAGAGAPRLRGWMALGVVYAGVTLLAPVMLRGGDGKFGVIAILFLFAVVWSTDVLGYFVGRALGGPRLAPAVSPHKTWSGALGGALGAVGAGVAVALAAGDLTTLARAAAAALALSIASQTGDLFESAVKRRFGVKDASRIIPGHGGLMDRLDGFIAASGTAALLGVLRGGVDDPARGFLLW